MNKIRNTQHRECHFRRGAGAHIKSGGAKRQAAKRETRRESQAW